MKNKVLSKRRILIGAGFGLLIIFLLFILKRTVLWKEEQKGDLTMSFPIVEMGMSSDRLGAYVVGKYPDQTFYVPYGRWFPKYIVSEIRHEDFFVDYEKVGSLDPKFYTFKTEISLYDWEKSDKIRNIELIKELRKIGVKNEYLYLLSSGIVEIEGEYIYHLEFIDRVDNAKKYIGWNLETGEVEQMEKYLVDENRKINGSNETINERWNRLLPLIFEDANLMEVNGLKFDANFNQFQPEMLRVLIRSNKLPQNNERLYTMFPEIEKYRDETGNYTLDLFIPSSWSVDEIFRLFTEDGKELIYEGVILDAEYSVDGKEHEIRSLEEYYHYQKKE